MAETSGAPSRTRTLTEEAYVAIKQRIIRLELPPGWSFSESQLALDLALGKTPVREALGRLHHEGFVDVSPRCGYTVSTVTLKDTRDLFALRILLEGEAAALAASTPLQASHLHGLETAARTDYDPHVPESIERFLQINTQLHATIAAASGNDRLREVLEHVLDQTERLFHLGLPWTTSAEDAMRDHQNLVNAIVQRDPDRARALAVAHLRASQSMVIDALLTSDALLSANISATPYALTRVTAEPGSNDHGKC